MQTLRQAQCDSSNTKRSIQRCQAFCHPELVEGLSKP